LRVVVKYSRSVPQICFSEAEFSWNYLVAKVSLADEHGHNKYPSRDKAGYDFFDVRILFPKSFTHLAKNSAIAQCGRMLIDHRRGIFVQRRSMPQQYEGRIG